MSINIENKYENVNFNAYLKNTTSLSREVPEEASAQEELSFFVPDELHQDQVLHLLARHSLIDRNFAFRDPDSLPALSPSTSALNSILELMNHRLVFPFKDYTLYKTYASILKLFDDASKRLFGKSFHSVRLAGSKCPKLLTAEWHAKQLENCLPALAPLFREHLDRTIDQHACDIDTHLLIHPLSSPPLKKNRKVNEQEASAEKPSAFALAEALVCDLVSQHHRILTFTLNYDLQPPLVLSGFQALVAHLQKEYQDPSLIAIFVGNEIPWLTGWIKQESLSNLLNDIVDLKNELDQNFVVERLAYTYLFKKSREEMHQFICQKGHAFEHYHAVFKTSPNGKEVLQERYRICCRDEYGEMHDFNLIDTSNSPLLRTVAQDMHIELSEYLKDRRTILFHYSHEAIKQKYCKELGWPHPEAANAIDWAYELFCVTQGYSTIEREISEIFHERLKKEITGGEEDSRTIFKLLQAPVNGHGQGNASEITALTFNACYDLRGKINPDTLKDLWELLAQQNKGIPSGLLGKIYSALTEKKQNLEALQSFLQLSAFLRLLSPLNTRQAAPAQIVLSIRYSQPAIFIITENQTLPFTLDPRPSLDCLASSFLDCHQQDFLQEFCVQNRFPFDANSPLFRFLPHLGLNCHSFARTACKHLNSKSPLVRQGALDLLYAAYALSPDKEIADQLLRHLPSYLNEVIDPSDRQRLHGVIKEIIGKHFSHLSHKSQTELLKKLDAIFFHPLSQQETLIAWLHALAGSQAEDLAKMANEIWETHHLEWEPLQQKEAGLELYRQFTEKHPTKASKVLMTLIQQKLIKPDVIQHSLESFSLACSQFKNPINLQHGLSEIAKLAAFCKKEQVFEEQVFDDLLFNCLRPFFPKWQREGIHLITLLRESDLLKKSKKNFVSLVRHIASEYSSQAAYEVLQHLHKQGILTSEPMIAMTGIYCCAAAFNYKNEGLPIALEIWNFIKGWRSSLNKLEHLPLLIKIFQQLDRQSDKQAGIFSEQLLNEILANFSDADPSFVSDFILSLPFESNPEKGKDYLFKLFDLLEENQPQQAAKARLQLQECLKKLWAPVSSPESFKQGCQLFLHESSMPLFEDHPEELLVLFMSFSHYLSTHGLQESYRSEAISVIKLAMESICSSAFAASVEQKAALMILFKTILEKEHPLFFNRFQTILLKNYSFVFKILSLHPPEFAAFALFFEHSKTNKSLTADDFDLHLKAMENLLSLPGQEAFLSNFMTLVSEKPTSRKSVEAANLPHLKSCITAMIQKGYLQQAFKLMETYLIPASDSFKKTIPFTTWVEWTQLFAKKNHYAEAWTLFSCSSKLFPEEQSPLSLSSCDFHSPNAERNSGS